MDSWILMKFWHADASQPSGPPELIKFENFWNPRWRRLPSWKIKTWYLKNCLTRFWMCGRCRSMGLIKPVLHLYTGRRTVAILSACNIFLRYQTVRSMFRLLSSVFLIKLFTDHYFSGPDIAVVHSCVCFWKTSELSGIWPRYLTCASFDTIWVSFEDQGHRSKFTVTETSIGAAGVANHQ